MGRFLKDFKKFFNYVVFSSKAELKSEVADSFLSWLWWFLDPLLYMLVYSFIAVVVFKSGVQYFPVFVFLGLNTWTFFSKTVKASVKLVANKKMIVTKVYIPKYMFVFEKITFIVQDSSTPHRDTVFFNNDRCLHFLHEARQFPHSGGSCRPGSRWHSRQRLPWSRP